MQCAISHGQKTTFLPAPSAGVRVTITMQAVMGHDVHLQAPKALGAPQRSQGQEREAGCSGSRPPAAACWRGSLMWKPPPLRPWAAPDGPQLHPALASHVKPFSRPPMHSCMTCQARPPVTPVIQPRDMRVLACPHLDTPAWPPMQEQAATEQADGGGRVIHGRDWDRQQGRWAQSWQS